MNCMNVFILNFINDLKQVIYLIIVDASNEMR